MMHGPARRTHALRRWLFAIVSMLAFTSQLTVAIAPLAEGREARMASHVEEHGSLAHFTHTDASCVSCQVRSMFGATSRHEVPVLRAAITSAPVDAAVSRFATASLLSLENP